MKVLHLISSAGIYGAEAVVLTLLQEMERAQQPCALGVFLNQTNPNVALHEAACKAGFESYLVSCDGQIDARTVKAIRALVLQTRADYVHTHGYKADVYGYFAMRGRPAILVATCHNWCDTDVATRVYGALDRRCLRRFAAVAAVSADVRQRLISAGLKPERTSVIHNGIDPAPFLASERLTLLPDVPRGENPTCLSVGFAGRLSSEKGIDLFLATAEGILKSMPDTRFLIAGDGAEREAVEHTLREKRLGSNIVLLGRCEDMPAFYASLDVLLSSSRTEGLPIGLMEAMASGVPVVATAVGDVPTLVESGVTGMLVPPLDVPAMQDAVMKLLRDEDLRTRLGEAGRRRVQHDFSAQRMAESYLSFYKRASEVRPAENVRSAV